MNFVAFQAATGKILWPPSTGPITYLLDGSQYVLVAGDSLYCFTLNQPAP